MSTAVRLLPALAAVPCLLAGAALAQEGEGKDDKNKKADEGPRPVLLIAGKDYLVHAVPRSLPVTRGPEKAPPQYTELDGLRAGQPHSYVLLHTTPSTGQTKTLLVSGGWRAQSPPMAIDRMFHGETRIVGTAVDARRLYVLCRHTAKIVMLQAAPGEGLEMSKGGYRLYMFNLADGRKLQERDLKDGELPKAAPAETLDRGPLQVVRDGVVRCYGREYDLKD